MPGILRLVAAHPQRPEWYLTHNNYSVNSGKLNEDNSTPELKSIGYTVTADLYNRSLKHQGRKVFIFFFFRLNEMFWKPLTKFLEHNKPSKMLAIMIENILEKCT